MSRMVLEGIKVADFSHAAVGPLTTQYLAQLGATVIKIDSDMHPDGSRSLPPFAGNISGLNSSGLFAMWNSTKRTIAINLGRPKGIELAKRLIMWADIVVENYSGHTMEKWGLGYENLRKMKPDIIMLSSCMHGQTGPFSRHKGYGIPLAALCGVSYLTGWPDRMPAGVYGPWTDYMSPRLNLAAIAGALIYRKRTGKGQYLDASQYESSLTFLSPLIMDYMVNGHVMERQGNRSPLAAPHGVFKCKGDARWCAIAVTSDIEWQAFCRVVGNPLWTTDPRFTTLEKRKQNEDALEELVEEWTKERPPEEVMELLQGAGVPAGIVESGQDLNDDPQLKHYNFLQMLDHQGMGLAGCPARTNTFRLSKADQQLWAAPTLGEHSAYVCTEILGMSDDELAELLNEGVLL